MKELHDILLAYDKAVLDNKQVALVTVVQVEGSSYRRPGARMLVTESGEITGAISGGCLEGDALRKAQMAMHQQKNRLEIYDTTDAEEDKLGIQLGCNGIVYILFEPICKEDPYNPIEVLKKLASHRKDAVLVTVFDPNKHAVQQGTCCFVNATEAHCKDDAMLAEEASTVLQQKASLIRELGRQTVLFQYIPPIIQLVIIGAGNDVQPLTEMAYLLGWRIVVVDGRPAYITQRRFPKADQLCLCKPGAVLSAISIDERTAIVLMTHNYNYDLAALGQLAQTQCLYLGVLGPRKKLNKMLKELKEQGIDLNEENLQAIYGPIGLDLGAETSEEIALSIMAEIKAVFANRRGASLRERQLDIHERSVIVQHA